MEEDARPVPDFLKEPSYEYLGSDPIPASRYTSVEFEKLEKEKMWPNIWQFAAREEDLLEPGDYVVFDNADRTFLIVRQDDGGVRAFHNVCLHRGRKLRTEDGCADKFQCPFHGYTWNKDGSLNEIPNRWDFGHLTDEKMKLPEAEVGRWGGYIFIKENPGGPSLEEFLAPLPEHFKRWRHENVQPFFGLVRSFPPIGKLQPKPLWKLGILWSHTLKFCLLRGMKTAPIGSGVTM